MAGGSLDCNRCPHIFERDPNKWGLLRSSLGECKPPKAVALTCVSALGPGPSLDAYLDAYEVVFLFGHLLWTFPFGHLFLEE